MSDYAYRQARSCSVAIDSLSFVRASSASFHVVFGGVMHVAGARGRHARHSSSAARMLVLVPLRSCSRWSLRDGPFWAVARRSFAWVGVSAAASAGDAATPRCSFSNCNVGETPNSVPDDITSSHASSCVSSECLDVDAMPRVLFRRKLPRILLRGATAVGIARSRTFEKKCCAPTHTPHR